jgi:hypothetical protein
VAVGTLHAVTDVHGAALVERVIERLDGDPVLSDRWFGSLRSPLPPDALAALRLPGDRPLPPSLRRWLGYDASMLVSHDWFEADGTRLRPRRLDDLAEGEYGGPEYIARGGGEDHYYGGPFDIIFREPAEALPDCFVLPGGSYVPPFGFLLLPSASKWVFAATTPDAEGEYPILETDVAEDELPSLDVAYPGLDVYLAARTGLIDDTRAALYEHPAYGPRMRFHIAQPPFNGAAHGICFNGYGWRPVDEVDEDDDE